MFNRARILDEKANMEVLDNLLNQSLRRLKLAFNEASEKFKTPEDVAQHRENAVKEFLKEFLPSTYMLGKGEIIDSKGIRSRQVDVIICNQYHPFTISSSGRGLFFAEGVVCAVEVKSDLSNKEEVKQALLQVQSVKKLERKPAEGDLMFGSAYDQERMRRIPSIIFTYQSPSLSTLKLNIKESYEELKIPIEETFDAVVSLEKGIIYNIKDERDNLMITVTGERKLGLVGVLHEKETLRSFLLYLSHIIPSEVKFIPIVRLYLQKLCKEDVRVL